MSQLRLQDALESLYKERTSENIGLCLRHSDYTTFQRKIGTSVLQDQFVQAFTHSSFTHEYNVPHQELLEFLGDSVLQLILTEELFRLFPKENEGKLSKLRSSIVNEVTLATLARGLGLGELILVGKGEFKKNLRNQNAVLADTFEAMLAQIYQTHGLKFTSDLYLEWLKEFVPNAFCFEQLGNFDAKSKLQEMTLAKFKKLPQYVAQEVSPGRFQVELWINEKLLLQGEFPSKRGGEKELAQAALKENLI